MKNNTYSEVDFQNHLKTEHKQSVFSEYLREIVYGGNDGIVTTFAVVAGFAGAQSGSQVIIPTSFLTVLLFGFANLFADGASMSLGNFLSIRSAQDVYQIEKEKELAEIRKSREMEKAETIHILKSKGFSLEDAIKITNIFSKNEKYWVEFMMNDELKMPNPENDNPFFTALATFFAFTFFGFIPLLPYILFKNSLNIFSYSVAFTFLALFLLGVLRFKVTKENIARSIGEIVFVGGISAAIAYFVGTFFA